MSLYQQSGGNLETALCRHHGAVLSEQVSQQVEELQLFLLTRLSHLVGRGNQRDRGALGVEGLGESLEVARHDQISQGKVCGENVAVRDETRQADGRTIDVQETQGAEEGDPEVPQLSSRHVANGVWRSEDAALDLGHCLSLGDTHKTNLAPAGEIKFVQEIARRECAGAKWCPSRRCSAAPEHAARHRRDSTDNRSESGVRTVNITNKGYLEPVEREAEIDDMAERIITTATSTTNHLPKK